MMTAFLVLILHQRLQVRLDGYCCAVHAVADVLRVSFLPIFVFATHPCASGSGSGGSGSGSTCPNHDGIVGYKRGAGSANGWWNGFGKEIAVVTTDLACALLCTAHARGGHSTTCVAFLRTQTSGKCYLYDTIKDATFTTTTSHKSYEDCNAVRRRLQPVLAPA